MNSEYGKALSPKHCNEAAFPIKICTRISIKLKSGSASNKNQDPDPHKSDELDPEPNPDQFAEDKPKCMENEPI